MRPSKTDYLPFLGLLAVTIFVLASSWLAPDPMALLRERYDLLGILVVSAVAQWGGVRAGLIAAVLSFVAVGTLGVPETRFLTGSAPTDLYVDGAMFLAVAGLVGVQTGQLRQRERAADRNERRWSLLSEFSARLVPEIPQVTEFIAFLELLADLLGAPAAFAFRPDERGELVSPNPASEDWLASHKSARRLVNQCAEAAKASLAREPEAAEPGGKRPRSFAAGVATPLVTTTGFFGVLYLAPKSDGSEFSEDDLVFVEVTAETITAYLERNALSAQIAESRAQAESDRLKASLLSSVSHELKTPLAAAMATVTCLRDRGPVDEAELAEELAAVNGDLRRLNDRIGDLLAMSRLETADWHPALDWNDPRDLFAAVVNLVPEATRSRVACALPVDMPMFRFDLVQISRALYHLVENALAYSPDDESVVVGGSWDDEYVRVWVEDRGPGLTEQEKRAAFAKFWRGRASGNAPQGTGLGLGIAQDILRHHGGRVIIEDAEPHGARFVIELEREAKEPNGH